MTDDVHAGARATHTLTIGTHNEFFNFRNLFIRDNFGTYRFSEPRQLRGGPRAAVRPQLLGDERSAAAGEVQGPPVRLLRRRSVARAVERHAHLRHPRRRAARSRTSRPPIRSRSPTSATRPTSCRATSSGRRASASTGTSTATAREQIRGGVGIFTGRRRTCGFRTSTATPASTSRASARRTTPATSIPFVADPHNQPTTRDRRDRGHVHERDRHDRSGLQVPVDPARQHRLRPGAAVGLRTGTVEFVWSKTVKDIKYQNLNFVPASGVTRRRRPAVLHAQGRRRCSDVILLDEHGPGLHRGTSTLRSAPAVQERLLRQRARTPTARPTSIMDGTSRPGGVELGQRLHAGRSEQRAADALELRSGPPHQR